MLLKVIKTFQDSWCFCQFLLKYQVYSANYLRCVDNNLRTVVGSQKISQLKASAYSLQGQLDQHLCSYTNAKY